MAEEEGRHAHKYFNQIKSSFEQYFNQIKSSCEQSFFNYLTFLRSLLSFPSFAIRLLLLSCGAIKTHANTTLLQVCFDFL